MSDVGVKGSMGWAPCMTDVLLNPRHLLRVQQWHLESQVCLPLLLLRDGQFAAQLRPKSSWSGVSCYFAPWPHPVIWWLVKRPVLELLTPSRASLWMWQQSLYTRPQQEALQPISHVVLLLLLCWNISGVCVGMPYCIAVTACLRLDVLISIGKTSSIGKTRFQLRSSQSGGLNPLSQMLLWGVDVEGRGKRVVS